MQGVRTFAISKFFIGDFDRTGVGPSLSAWEAFGYDLDGKATPLHSRDVCTPVLDDLGAQIDGHQGIDNTFGSNLLPMIKLVVSDPSEELTNTVRAGAYTYLVQIDGLSDDPKQTNLKVGGQLLLSAPFGQTPPSFTKSDDWPIRVSTLTDGQLGDGANMRFREAYINAGTWVSAPLGDVLLELKLAGEGQPQVERPSRVHHVRPHVSDAPDERRPRGHPQRGGGRGDREIVGRRGVVSVRARFGRRDGSIEGPSDHEG